MKSKKSCLSFKTIKGSLECGLLGSAGSKKLRGSFLSCGGWAQPEGNRNPSYTEFDSWPRHFARVTGLRKTHQISCHSLWLGREGKGFWYISGGVGKCQEDPCTPGRELCLKRPSVMSRRESSSDKHAPTCDRHLKTKWKKPLPTQICG